MDLQQRITAFVSLGKTLSEMLDNEKSGSKSGLEVFLDASSYNEWFTKENIRFALSGIAENLTKNNIQEWLNKYPQISNLPQKRIGVVTAGNIPLVGFHDLLCVLIAGYEIVIKVSSKDDKLITALINLLIEHNEGFKRLIHFKDGQLKRWKTLSEDGYISVVRKIKMSTKKIDNESLKLLWVEDGQSTHIYSPRELEEGESMALYLAEKWNCGVYLPHKKVWLRERG